MCVIELAATFQRFIDSTNRSRSLFRLWRFRFALERALCLIDNRFKGGFVGDGEIGQNFSIETDAGGFKTFGKPAVGQAVGAGRGVEALDPKITESAFARFAIAISPVFAFHGRVFGVTKKFRTATAITFGGFDDALASFPAGPGIGCSWHFVLSRHCGTPRSARCCYIVDLSDLAR